MSRIEQFFSTNFLAPHGYCFLWLPEIVWLHVFADALIALAYFSIPLALWVFVKKRPDMPFRNLFLLFASFITLCGLTHIAGIIVLWYPAYGYEGLLMLLTGIVSAGTAVVVWRILPHAVKLPSPAQFEKMNHELKTAYTKVEQKVIERTQELMLANDELEKEKQKMAMANEAKKQFIANISHELRTPLNAVVILSEKFRNNSLPEDKKQEALDSLYSSSIMLRELIHDILDFSKIESQALELAKEPFDIHELIDEITAITSVQSAEKDIYFEVDKPSQPIPNVVGDVVRLKQALLNLLSNAIKFTDVGGVTLALAFKESVRSVAFTIKVIDTGIGISKKHQERIFEEFVQANYATVQHHGGTGLGLSITKHLVELMGGDLELQSTNGEGSTFTINLSLPKANLYENESPTIPASTFEPVPDETPSSTISEPNPNANGRILVVEDNPGNILVATILLEEMGYDFDVAKNGSEAINLFIDNDYSLVLMDLRLPDMSGYDITAQLRTTEERAKLPSTPIIAMTAFATKEEQEKCKAYGMNGFTTKPIDIEALRNHIETWIHKPKSNHKKSA